MTLRVCLTCRHWEAKGVPAYAAEMGMAFCLNKKTKAVSLSHWRDCGAWVRTDPAAIDKRVVWLKRRSIEPVLQTTSEAA